MQMWGYEEAPHSDTDQKPIASFPNISWNEMMMKEMRILQVCYIQMKMRSAQPLQIHVTAASKIVCLDMHILI